MTPQRDRSKLGRAIAEADARIADLRSQILSVELFRGQLEEIQHGPLHHDPRTRPRKPSRTKAEKLPTIKEASGCLGQSSDSTTDVLQHIRAPRE